jgi:hypothetical protein
MSTITTSGGSERKQSTTSTIAQLIGRMPRLRSRARARPAARPVATTSKASSIVTITPGQDVGRYFHMTFPLRKVSRKRSQRLNAAGSGR